jgi:hypothetical protein
MTNDKAREFFSAYADGTLEPGLKQSFEHRLRSSSSLQQEYRDFEQTLDELGALRFEYIEVPNDLHDRITARIDRQVYEQKQAAAPAWHGWVRNLGFAGLAAAAIFGAIIGLNSRRPSDDAVLGGGVSLSSNDSLAIKSVDGSVVLSYAPSVKHDVSVSSATTGQVLRKVSVGSDGWTNSLQNKQPEPALFEIAISGEQPTTLIALPGQSPYLKKAGQGTLKDFAKTLAGVYHVPVVLKAAHPDQPLAWNLTVPNAAEAASGILGTQRFTVDDRETGVVWIQEQ